MNAPLKLISADSHVVEPANCYVDNIEAKYRDRAPRLERGEKGGDYFVMDGYRLPAPVANLASCGMDLAKAKFETLTLNDVHHGAFDPKQRVQDQDRDGVKAEVLYPSLGMFVCGHEDGPYKQACMWAYNRWLHEFTSYAPDRLIGLGQTAVCSVDEAIEDLRKFKEMGFRGVMLPSEPATDEDYHDKMFDPLWRAAVELEMPVSFHILTAKATWKSAQRVTAGKISAGTATAFRGPNGHTTLDVVRQNQDVIGMFIWSGVFERHPDLKLVCVEADASWAPHMMYRMDHYFLDRPDMRYAGAVKERPSFYFKRNVYLTFQNDWIAFDLLKYLNYERLLWANDFPHPDGCWPHSQSLLTEHAAHLTPAQRDAIVHGNVAALYGLK